MLNDFLEDAVEELKDRTSLVFEGEANDVNLTLNCPTSKTGLEIVFFGHKDLEFRKVRHYWVNIKTTQYDYSYVDELDELESEWKVINKAANRIHQLYLTQQL